MDTAPQLPQSGHDFGVAVEAAYHMVHIWSWEYLWKGHWWVEGEAPTREGSEVSVHGWAVPAQVHRGANQ